MSTSNLEEAQRAIQQGDKAKARNLLRNVLLQDQHETEAWMLFAQVAANKEQALYCLEQAVRLEPNREKAQRWLAMLRDDDSEVKKERPINPPKTQESSERAWEQYCPYLGIEDDPQSLTSFPSTLNFCYRDAEDPQAVETSHQSSFCLNGNHARCPTFLAQKEKLVGREALRRIPRLIGNSLAANLSKIRFWGLALLIGLALSEFFALVIWG